MPRPDWMIVAAGPALDHAVGTALGWTFRPDSDFGEGAWLDAAGRHRALRSEWEPSTAIAAAWLVVEAIAARGIAIAVRFNPKPDGGNGWAKAGTWTAGRLSEESTTEMLSEETGETVYYLGWSDAADAETAALAICRCALAIAECDGWPRAAAAVPR